jgi:hypothetical protein
VIVSPIGNLLPVGVAEGDNPALLSTARGTLVSSADTAASGTNSFKGTVTNNVGGVYSVALAGTSNYIPVVAGSTYTIQTSVKSGGAAPNSAYISVDWYNAAGGFVSTMSSPATAINSSSWTTITATGAAPGTAAYGRYYAVGLGGVYAIGDVFYVDKVGFWQGSGGQWAAPGNPIYQ